MTTPNGAGVEFGTHRSRPYRHIGQVRAARRQHRQAFPRPALATDRRQRPAVGRVRAADAEGSAGLAGPLSGPGARALAGRHAWATTSDRRPAPSARRPHGARQGAGTCGLKGLYQNEPLCLPTADEPADRADARAGQKPSASGPPGSTGWSWTDSARSRAGPRAVHWIRGPRSRGCCTGHPRFVGL